MVEGFQISVFMFIYHAVCQGMKWLHLDLNSLSFIILVRVKKKVTERFVWATMPLSAAQPGCLKSGYAAQAKSQARDRLICILASMYGWLGIPPLWRSLPHWLECRLAAVLQQNAIIVVWRPVIPCEALTIVQYDILHTCIRVSTRDASNILLSPSRVNALTRYCQGLRREI